jgi:APA family basic amino acid/polyamine antiporter
MVSIGTLFAFSLVCIGVIVMRKTNPNAVRGFRVPLVPFLPILGVIICVALMAGLPIESWERLGIWLLLGLLIYFFYSKKQSKMNNSK